MLQRIDSNTSIGHSHGAEYVLRTAKLGDDSRSRRAAQEFEAILLAQCLEKLQESLASFGSDEDTDPGHETFQEMGLESIASTLARTGGIGIADLIMRHLPTEVSSPQCRCKQQGIREQADNPSF